MMNFLYTEYALRNESQIPGWDAIIKIVKLMLEKNEIENILYFEVVNKFYKLKTIEEISDNINTLNILSDELKTDDLCMIVMKSENIDNSLINKYYENIGVGTLHDFKDRNVFWMPLNINKYDNIYKKKCLFIIHHDGDPCFIIKKK